MIAVKKEVLDYIIEEGLSPHSKVYKGYKKDGVKEFVTIKVIPKSELAESILKNEAAALKIIDNENVVKLKDVVETETECFLIFEYCSGSDLRQYMEAGEVKPETAQSIAIQIINGLNTLYANNISHETLTSKNILVSNTNKPTIKLFNFTIAQRAKNPNFAVGVNQSEQAEKGSCISENKELSDTWAIGVLLYELVCKQELKIEERTYKVPKGLKLSAQCLDLLNKCLQEKTECGWEEIREHPYVKREPLEEFDLEEFIERNPVVKAMIIEDEHNYIFSTNIKYTFLSNQPENRKEEEDELALAESCGPLIEFEDSGQNFELEALQSEMLEEAKKPASEKVPEAPLSEEETEYVKVSEDMLANKEYSTAQYGGINITETYFC
eukprot:TRINITY_DN10688_c0_g1_i11.p1 TRINITY_DN10688_c0_g1~~TRINITY_DN10688_c0_g1_i11.p1  ORF type:complete len:383 (-),score=112.68 TRINITY_DN10688_c0_g1_i11:158-1306(-)